MVAGTAYYYVNHLIQQNRELKRLMEEKEQPLLPPQEPLSAEQRERVDRFSRLAEAKADAAAKAQLLPAAGEEKPIGAEEANILWPEASAAAASGASPAEINAAQQKANRKKERAAATRSTERGIEREAERERAKEQEHQAAADQTQPPQPTEKRDVCRHGK